MVYLAIVLQFLDVATTYYALRNIDGASEVNGFAAKIMAKIGLVPTLSLKLVAAFGLFAYVIGQPGEDLFFLVANIIYAGIVLNNLKVIRDNR